MVYSPLSSDRITDGDKDDKVESLAVVLRANAENNGFIYHNMQACWWGFTDSDEGMITFLK